MQGHDDYYDSNKVLEVDLIVTDQAIVTTTPAGRLLFHVLAAIAVFERDLIRDRVIAGLRRARAQGRRLGRPPKYRVDLTVATGLLPGVASLRGAARRLGIHPFGSAGPPGSSPSGRRARHEPSMDPSGQVVP